MSMESDVERLESIKALDGLLVRHAEGSFWAIFDRDFSLVLDGVESRQAALTARTSDVSEISKDALLTVGSEQFRIKRQEPDGTGMTTIILKR